MSPQREAHPLAWPSSLCRREPKPVLIYLDLNHWINLAKAATNHRQGGPYQTSLEWCRAARESGSALFPLSSTHYVELYKNRNSRQRASVATLMEELSGFVTLLSKSCAARLELDAALSARFGPTASTLIPLPLLGDGIAWAFGRKGLRVLSSGKDMTEEFRSRKPEQFQRARQEMERKLLAGPAKSDLPQLLKHGWKPEAFMDVTERRAQQERDQVRRFQHHPEFPKAKLPDAILVREIITELEQLIAEVLVSRGLSLHDILTSRDDLNALVRSMPTSRVSIELKTAMHRNPQRAWAGNDIHDIDALSLAIPYCDAVLTDKHIAHMARSTHLDQLMGTRVLSNLTELHDDLPC